MNEKTLLKYAVIGCGSFGRHHIDALVLRRDIEIVALCDKHIEKCHEVNEKYSLNAQCFDDYNEMLSSMKFDIVTVATSDKAHAGATIAALNAGSHVLCEKPMSLFVDECKDMVTAADKTGKLLMVGQIGRFAPAFIEAKKFVDQGLIGELFFIESEYAHDYSHARGTDDWRVDPDREPIIGGACHAIDLIRWIAGDPVETTAYSNHKVLTDWPVDDATVAIFKFPNNVIGKVFTSIGCKREYTMRTVIYGTKGTITVDNTSSEFTINLSDGNLADGMFGAGEAGIKHKLKANINNHNTAGEHAAMIDSVVNGAPLLMTGREGAKTVMVCRAVVESAKTGKAVKIEYDI
ncbi:MAG: Gfo/Idh/MocA family oxidoreductase [Ruminococcaceae bacterium]|nr:Gfo/Idh/MocA family oxidoreductase [Oscillospiraceae bacterium]